MWDIFIIFPSLAAYIRSLFVAAFEETSYFAFLLRGNVFHQNLRLSSRPILGTDLLTLHPIQSECEWEGRSLKFIRARRYLWLSNGWILYQRRSMAFLSFREIYFLEIYLRMYLRRYKEHWTVTNFTDKFHSFEKYIYDLDTFSSTNVYLIQRV